MKLIRFHPDAELEMIDAAGWYETQQADLGKRFITSVQDALNRVQVKTESCTCLKRLPSSGGSGDARAGAVLVRGGLAVHPQSPGHCGETGGANRPGEPGAARGTRLVETPLQMGSGGKAAHGRGRLTGTVRPTYRTIQEALGHETVETTLRYVNCLAPETQSPADVLPAPEVPEMPAESAQPPFAVEAPRRYFIGWLKQAWRAGKCRLKRPG